MLGAAHHMSAPQLPASRSGSGARGGGVRARAGRGSLRVHPAFKQLSARGQARAVVECGRVLDVAARHAGACREAADQLAFLHAELEALRAPAWDVPTAADVLLTGALWAHTYAETVV